MKRSDFLKACGLLGFVGAVKPAAAVAVAVDPNKPPEESVPLEMEYEIEAAELTLEWNSPHGHLVYEDSGYIERSYVVHVRTTDGREFRIVAPSCMAIAR